MHLPTMFAMIMMASAVMAASIAIVAHHKHADLQAWARAAAKSELGQVSA